LQAAVVTILYSLQTVSVRIKT